MSDTATLLPSTDEIIKWFGLHGVDDVEAKAAEILDVMAAGIADRWEPILKVTFCTSKERHSLSLLCHSRRGWKQPFRITSMPYTSLAGHPRASSPHLVDSDNLRCDVP